jgi:predicted RNA binding protein YcfA (HicA-like mRNA interferase family)
MRNKPNKTGRSKVSGSFVMLEHFMLRSEAWLSLTPAARAVYITVAAIYNGRNNGYLALSTRDAALRCRINKDTATKALAMLVERGFIEVGQRGHFDYKARHATEWRLTSQRCDRTHQSGSHAFMRWREEKMPVPNEGRSGPLESDRPLLTQPLEGL